MKNSSWRVALLARFGDREDLGKAGLYHHYFGNQGLPENEVTECLDLLEEELTIPPGILRPRDSLDLLFEPVTSKNPFRWMEYQARAGDRQAVISSRLSDKLREYGTFSDWETIETVDDLVRAWCGEKPDTRKSGN